MSSFDQALAIVVGNEGGFTSNPNDPGNWTSGVCFQGRCSGTKYGISAASYPDTDISMLTLETAGAIYRRDYWDRVHGDDLPPMLALLVFDAAVNNGVSRATRWLQTALGVVEDGIIGKATLGAAAATVPKQAATEFMVLRLMFMTSLGTWRTFGHGWARRLCRLPYDAMSVRDEGLRDVTEGAVEHG